MIDNGDGAKGPLLELVQGFDSRFMTSVEKTSFSPTTCSRPHLLLF